MTFRWAALGAALFGSGLALGACGGQSALTTTGPASTTATTATTAPATVSTTASATVTTLTHTVVGTTPDHSTVTETTVQVTTTPPGPSGIALESGQPLGTTSTTIQGQEIDGIECNRQEQLAYQTFAHLLVYVDGQPRALPGGIGLVSPRASADGTTTTYSQGLCAYWVMTRAANGLIQVHSPVPERYTLGDLFDIWDEPLSSTDVAGALGHVSASVNGKPWPGNPRGIPLREHEAIQLAVGRPVPRFQRVDWSTTDL